MRRYRGFDTDNARWAALEHREGDIVISSPMKAGTTWTQMICALLVFQSERLPAPLGVLSPWLDMQTQPIDDVVAALDAQTHRRFIKTHTPLDGLRLDERVTYIGVGRHPIDLVLSAARHSANVDFDTTFGKIAATIGDDEAVALLADRPISSQEPGARLRFFLEEEHPPEVALTLSGVIDHYRTFFESDARVLTLHYSDMVTDLDQQMRRLADGLDIEVRPDAWPALVEAASFTNMKARSAELVPDAGQGIIKDADAFFARAAEGAWRTEVSEDDLARFEERLAEIDPGGEITGWALGGMTP
jgi:aryl sulfotransferase